MKVRIIIFLLISLSISIIAQEQREEQIEQKTEIEQEKKSVRDFLHGEVVIPMVFHVIHGGGIENVTDAQIIEAVKQINEDYNALTPGIENVIPEFKDVVGDIGVTFALARKDPEGNSTSGIIRYYSPYETTQINGLDLPMKDNYRWPIEKYLNIYVISSAGPESGSAWAYGTWSEDGYDGVVISYWALGRTGTATPTHIKILTHELGHWFDLAHTFGSNCEDRDGIEDTPPCTQGSGCVLYDTVCDRLANRQNFMDYTRCQVMFTKGQKEVMLNVLDSSAHGRDHIWTKENQIATGVIGEPVSASFCSEQIMTVPGDTIQFIDHSVSEKGEIISWEWEFQGGNPSSFSGKNPPPVFYDQYGAFDVKLTVANENGDKDFELKKNYINVHTDIYMQNADFTVSSGKFFDTGYKLRYSSRTDRELVLRPKEKGKFVQVIFSMFEMEKDTLDYLEIYDGPDTSNDLIGKYWGINSPCVVTSSHKSGALTFVSHSNVEFRYRGWEANILTVDANEISKVGFIAHKTIITVGEEIFFTNLSSGLNNNVKWEFEGGTPSISKEINPTIKYNDKGKFKVILKVKNKTGRDQKVLEEYISVGIGKSLPYKEDFEKMDIPNDWEINNPDGKYKWGVFGLTGYKSVCCIMMNNSNNDSIGEKDEIMISPLDLSQAEKANLTFDVAYTKFDEESEDKLIVFASADAGLTWNKVYEKNQIQLETVDVPTDDSNGWFPVKEADWRKEEIDLNQYAGKSYVLIKFQNVSGFGTKIWLDNVSVSDK